MSSKKASTKDRLEAHLTAITFAEAGELKEARAILGMAPKQQVLLVTERETISQKGLECALAMAQANGSGISVLMVLEAPKGAADYGNFEGQLHDAATTIMEVLVKLRTQEIEPKITLRIGTPHQKIWNYLKRHKEVSAVIYDVGTEAASRHQNRISRFLKDLSRHIYVPFYAISE
jgi:hypothetical protein